MVKNDSEKGSKHKRHFFRWFLIIVLLLLLSLVGLFYWYSGRNVAFEFEEPIPVSPDIDLNPDNSQLYSILAQAGIDDAMVDVQEKEVLVALTIPSGKSLDDILSFVYGVATGFSPNAEKVTVHVVGDNSIDEYSVMTGDVLKFADGIITKDEFDKSVAKKSMTS